MTDLIKIITIYDNIPHHPNFQSDWGFGCIIDHPKARILFDTGAKPKILKVNLEMASIPPESIDIVVISHKHWDHKGGASWIVEQNPKATVYMPRTFSKTLERKLLKQTPHIISVSESMSIDGEGHFYLVISENMWIRELALAINTKKGAIVLTGCSHTGIHQIAKCVHEKNEAQHLCYFGGLSFTQIIRREDS